MKLETTLCELLRDAREIDRGAGVRIRTNDPEKLRQKLYGPMKITNIHYKMTIPNEPETLCLLPKKQVATTFS